jgi:hypothetical protein
LDVTGIYELFSSRGMAMLAMAQTSAGAVEDDDNLGADKTNPDGANMSGALLSARSACIGPNSSRAFTFQATIN